MMDEMPWRETNLGEVCEAQGGSIQTGPFGSQLHASDYKETGVPVVMPADIVDYRVSEAAIARITEEDADRLGQHRLRSGDIVFSRRGDVTRFAHITDREIGWLCGTGCLKIRLGQKVIADDRFMSFYLRLPDIKEWLIRHAVGATMPNLNTGILSAIPLHLPPLQEQLAIADSLGQIEDRITLLRETNATLEAITQALFKSWFVDFDPVRAKAEGREPEGVPPEVADLFPDELVESELGMIPKGWSEKAVYDLAEYVNGAAYKAFAPNTDKIGLPIIKIAELKAGITNQTAYSAMAMPSKYRIYTGDILFSWSGNPDTSIDTFVWHHGEGWLNQHIFKVVGFGVNERPFVLQTLKYLRPVFAEIARNKQTTGLGHVTVADMKRLLVAYPSKPVLAGFAAIISPIHEKIFNNSLQAISLASLRDTLLPRLMSGKLRITEAEKELEAV